MNRNDRLLIAGMILISALLFAGLCLMNREAGSTAVITVDGTEVMRVPLGTDGSYQVEGLLGSTTICTENGSIFVEEAPCPDQICVRHRRIRNTGEQIVCLPGRILIEIEGGQESGIDGIAG